MGKYRSKSWLAAQQAQFNVCFLVTELILAAVLTFVYLSY
jgi:hypothetical protein